jgi:hypothetical protein
MNEALLGIGIEPPRGSIDSRSIEGGDERGEQVRKVTAKSDKRKVTKRKVTSKSD